MREGGRDLRGRDKEELQKKKGRKSLREEKGRKERENL